jgi:hypothetical protein
MTIYALVQFHSCDRADHVCCAEPRRPVPSSSRAGLRLDRGPRLLEVIPGAAFDRSGMAAHGLLFWSLAGLLGFEDPNSFGRAFRAWEEMPPAISARRIAPLLQYELSQPAS